MKIFHVLVNSSFHASFPTRTHFRIKEKQNKTIKVFEATCSFGFLILYFIYVCMCVCVCVCVCGIFPLIKVSD